MQNLAFCLLPSALCLSHIMEFSNLADFILGGFYAALSKFQSEFLQAQEKRDMALQEKLEQVLQYQQVSQELITTINQAVTDETQQATEAVATLTQTNSQQQETITQLGQQIKDLLAQVESGQTQVAQAEQVIDQIIQQQQAQLSQQQEAVSKIEQIFK